MSVLKPKIGIKDAGCKITKKLAEIRRKPLSNKILNIIEEINNRNQKNNKEIARYGDAEV